MRKWGAVVVSSYFISSSEGQEVRVGHPRKDRTVAAGAEEKAREDKPIEKLEVWAAGGAGIMPGL